jgi:hypothetical protein
MYCGVEIIVQQAISEAALPSIHNLIRLARSAAQSKNHQEAYEYFTRVLELDSHHCEAWVGKANASGWLSNETSFRIPEMITCLSSAIESSSLQNEAEANANASQIISQVITQYYNRLRMGYSPAFAEEQSWALYVNRLRDLIKAVDQAASLLPQSVEVLQTGLYICGDNLGQLRFFRRNDGLPAYRVVPDDLRSTLSGRQERYTDALYRIDPNLRPVVVQEALFKVQNKQGLSPVQWVLIGLGVMIVLFILSEIK